MAALLKTFITCLQLIIIIAVVSIGIGFIIRGGFTFAYVFTANFFAGVVIICAALVMMFLPASFKLDKLTDHTTFNERYVEKQGQRKERAYEFLFLGIMMIITTGLIQLLLSVLVPLN